MEHDPTLPAVPAIPAPEPFAERRHAFRRGEDRDVHEERALLARALDILAGPDGAATQVAEILALVARVVGARRAALVADGPVRRVLVVAAPGEDPAAARALGSWLDATAPRPAAVRAAAAPAEILVVRVRRGEAGAPAGGRTRDGTVERFIRLDDRRSAVHLGLELVDPADAEVVAGRLPATTLRHLLAALAAASGRAADEAERALLRARERERERFVSMVVHELRTPLTGLGGYLDLLAGGALDDPGIGREFIERGRGIVDRMGGLIGDLLELSRLEAGSVRLVIEAVSVADTCERALAAMAPIAAGRRISIATDLSARLRTARADRRRVEQIVTNLVANACKFAPEGGHVEVAVRFAGPVALIVVRDDGPGIERADRERVFRPFARLDGHDGIPGTGLGLPISRDLARAMGGDVGLASVPGSGSAFIVGLPADTDVARAAVVAAIAAATEDEEVTLEEQAILRAIRGGDRTPRRATPGASRAGEGVAASPQDDAA
jgi:signal transduction histidine kinase